MRGPVAVQGRFRSHLPRLWNPWQVLGRSEIPFEDMISLDYMYVATWSLREDARILVRTVGAIARARGAY